MFLFFFLSNKIRTKAELENCLLMVKNNGKDESILLFMAQWQDRETHLREKVKDKNRYYTYPLLQEKVVWTRLEGIDFGWSTGRQLIEHCFLVFLGLTITIHFAYWIWSNSQNLQKWRWSLNTICWRSYTMVFNVLCVIGRLYVLYVF